MEITFRKSTPSDVAELQRLNNEIFVDNKKYDDDLDSDWAASDSGFNYFTSVVNDSDQFCMIAMHGDHNIGYIAGSPKKISYRLKKYFEIDNMGVSPIYQGKGVGQQLIERSFAWAKSHGFQKVFVTAYSKNKRAISFYQNADFQEIDISLERDL